MPRAKATREYLNVRRRLFREMLAVTQDLNDALAIEEVTSDSLGIIDSLIDAREALMEEVDLLDTKYRSDGGVAGRLEADGQSTDEGGSPGGEAADATEEIRRAARVLFALQEQIDERLKRHRERVQERIKDVRSRRSSLSGYYNAAMASRPRYVDARK